MSKNVTWIPHWEPDGLQETVVLVRNRRVYIQSEFAKPITGAADAYEATLEHGDTLVKLISQPTPGRILISSEILYPAGDGHSWDNWFGPADALGLSWNIFYLRIDHERDARAGVKVEDDEDNGEDDPTS